MLWKNDWQAAKTNLVKWWEHKGPALCLTSPRNKPLADLPKPQKPADIEAVWTDPVYRRTKGEYDMANTCFFAEAFPMLDTNVGPGSTSTFLGSRPHFAENTVWYEPCISDPDTYGPIRFDPARAWFQRHVDILKEGVAHAAGRYIVMLPDMIENLDTLAAMRDTQALLMDMIERPAWVAKKVDEINEAYFASFDALFDIVKDEDGGNAFIYSIWGPGKTAKVQCDISCMVSPAMYNELCVPALRRQCQWLDYSMYHLDGEDALQHLDSLLAIPELDAIQWTPIGASGKVAGMPTPGSPTFYDLYKRILKGDKSVQVGVKPDEVIPLLDAVGPAGMFITVRADDQATAQKLYEKTRQYY